MLVRFLALKRKSRDSTIYLIHWIVKRNTRNSSTFCTFTRDPLSPFDWNRNMIHTCRKRRLYTAQSHSFVWRQDLMNMIFEQWFFSIWERKWTSDICFPTESNSDEDGARFYVRFNYVPRSKKSVNPTCKTRRTRIDIKTCRIDRMCGDFNKFVKIDGRLLKTFVGNFLSTCSSFVSKRTSSFVSIRLTFDEKFSSDVEIEFKRSDRKR